MSSETNEAGLDPRSFAAPEPLVINVGPLDGLGSFVFWASAALQNFTAQYAAHQSQLTTAPTVVWDFRNLVAGHVSMAALTAVLGVAERLRRFTEATPTALFRWSPELFAFLEHTDFFRLLRDLDLIELNPDVVGGYGHHLGKHNPATKFIYFPGVEAPSFEDRQAWAEWKDATRREISTRLRHYTGEAFRPTRRKPISDALEENVRAATAELVLNSYLWGKSTAFVGVQRSGAGISVAVCDAGVGFQQSLRARAARAVTYDVSTEARSVALGSLSNFREYGLRRVIAAVLQEDGRIWMWSNGGEVFWRPTLWNSYAHIHDPKALQTAIEQPISSGKVSPVDRDRGYIRDWDEGIRGARITFEIPLR